MKRLSAIIFLIVFFGCASSKITSQWSEPGTPKLAVKKVLVMGFVRNADYGIQENMERHLVDDLKELGYDAVSSFQKYGPKAFDGMNEVEAIQSMRDNAFDAVLTIVLLDKEKDKNYYHEYFYYTPFMYYYGNFWGYRMMMYDRIYQPGYYVTTTRYFWESNLYSTANQKLIYTVQTESFDPASTEKMAHEYGNLIATELNHDVIQKPVY
jgi:hypothetical protein